MKPTFSLDGCESREELVLVAEEQEDEVSELMRRQCINAFEYTEAILDIRKELKRRLLSLNN
jgi:hypothetical protein